ncbi:bifunctional isocitrate dehydrogenase kinase/phosphatase [Lamprobacter modestohalophilus]|uniref:bifunctional isocitrate dehydrogenase kinase/phosphatase n=1 Tax=Lamprobacter modestohalophilus TaxID=1064514 RepID=UPI002ADEF2EA|nr:bifunctional isocitrate dehydrogenase kinase/phosphatase [Lamprobacter modestohalophilus]MEA1053261.1 bifunctional isocitrate dehydrogenase kinase/phosphatase [Lamprobacter modestohalophilus]
MAWLEAKQLAEAILDGFDRHYRLFRTITADARVHFEQADWPAAQRCARERIDFYDCRVGETVAVLRREFHLRTADDGLWRRVKVEYSRLLPQHHQPELAETFYNSVFCRLFDRRYYNNAYIFVWPLLSTEHLEAEVPIFRPYYPGRDGFLSVITDILHDMDFARPFRHRRRDVRNLMRAIRERFPMNRARHQNFQLAVLSTPFFRNKAAYIIGKAINGADQTPFLIPVLNDEHGGLYVDALLTGADELSNVFSFSRAYFLVDTEVPAAIVEFLRPLMPRKSKAELYTAMGLQKFGKAEFYRDFLKHLRYSSDQLVVAPGIRGMVMCVFTLPSFPFVFKVIKDRFPPPKEMTREQVMAKYRLVKLHDRVGRMADSWEYSHVAFPRERFSDELIAMLRAECAGSVNVEGGQVVVKHLYIERRMSPLNLYLASADDEDIAHAAAEYGDAIRQLAAADIFPGDFLFKNFGVTRQGRVVFYDYDELCYLTQCHFRDIPEPPFPEMEMADEPWYTVGPADVFPEEFETFLLTEPRFRKAFRALHADIFDPLWWRERQAAIRAGQVEDVFPYPSDRRFGAPPGLC